MIIWFSLNNYPYLRHTGILGVERQLHLLLISALADVNGQLHTSANVPPGEEISCKHWKVWQVRASRRTENYAVCVL